MNILFTVCARAGSKGVKNKNIREFLGYPLIYYTLSVVELFIKDHGKKYSSIDVCISSDGEDIINTAKNFMDINIINRPSEISGDTTSKVLVIKHAINNMEKRLDKKYDYVIDLDVTSPIRTVNDIYECLNKKVNNSNLDVVFSVVDSRRNPSFNMVEEFDNNIVRKVIDSNFTARQQVKPCYDMNASIYVYNRDTLIKDDFNNVFDGNCGVYKMKDTGILDIDCENDFELLEVISDYLFKKDKNLKVIRDYLIL